MITGCGGDDEPTTAASETTSGTTAAPTETQETQTDTAPSAAVAERRLKRAAKIAGPVADCLRESGAEVSTEPADVSDPRLIGPGVVGLRMKWKGSEADIVVLSTPRAAKRLEIDADSDRVIRKKGFVFVFDDAPKTSITTGVDDCLQAA